MTLMDPSLNSHPCGIMITMIVLVEAVVSCGLTALMPCLPEQCPGPNIWKHTLETCCHLPSNHQPPDTLPLLSETACQSTPAILLPAPLPTPYFAPSLPPMTTSLMSPDAGMSQPDLPPPFHHHPNSHCYAMPAVIISDHFQPPEPGMKPTKPMRKQPPSSSTYSLAKFGPQNSSSPSPPKPSHMQEATDSSSTMTAFA